MGNMGQQHLRDATSAASHLHHLMEMWKSPRGTVLRIEALALVAIALSFFLAAFGSYRRQCSHWFFQKAFLAANALFLSLGTYSIGLMQSSPVKSELYPIWAVSLLALLCCVDSAAVSGLDNKSQLWKMLYQLCLYFGYVLLMSISTISMDIGNIAICVLSAITFIKGFHMSMALVLPSSMRNMIREIPAGMMQKCSFGNNPVEEDKLLVDGNLDIMIGHYRGVVDMGDIARSCPSMRDVCLSFSLSHLLHRRFLGLSSVEPAATSAWWPLVRDYERALEVVKVELAFMYDVLYTSNAFLHYYEARGASIWALASVAGIAFVGATAIVIPGERTSRRASPGSSAILVDTTMVDIVITGVILVSLALLQVLQLLRCWTSNWARVAYACDRARNANAVSMRLGMGLRASLLKINWFDDKDHLWQNKLGQHSLIDKPMSCGSLGSGSLGSFSGRISSCTSLLCLGLMYIIWICCWPLRFLVRRCLGLIGLQYISREVKEMFRDCSTPAFLCT